MKYNLITILGPTAVGKTRLAALLADHFDGEIISADSRQVYKGMDIGTGKDLNDYVVDGKIIPVHLIDVLEPHEEFNLFLFKELFYESFKRIISKNKIPFLVGGTGLYLNSILKQYDLAQVNFDDAQFSNLSNLTIPELQGYLKKINPRLHNTTDLLDKDRIIKAIIVTSTQKEKPSANEISIHSLVLGIKLERPEVKKRITKRLKQRLESGMVEEVKRLIDSGLTYGKLDFFGLEYKYIGKYLKGELNYNDMYQKLNSAIHDFAKKQMTWFRKMERERVNIHWIDAGDYKSAEQIINTNYFS
ncbi:MAG: tRNA (adenosine(37)-N6)-dimethylallyltransferase MiaA [Bacteroidota bacterium]